MSRKITVEFLGKDKSLGRTADQIEGRTSKLGGRLASFGKRAALGFGAATVAGGVFLAKVGGPYVDSLNKIQALTEVSNARMKRVAHQLEANAGMYAKMGQTTGDAAAGVVELTKAGMKLDDAMKAVNATMVLAKAGELSVADASSLVANTLNTFHLQAGRAGDIANYLANAANISSADVTDLAESLKYVAPVAASTGVSLRQTNAILAELSNSGISASNAGTGFRKFLLSLQAPSGAAAKDLKALGVEIFDSSGKMKPLGKVIDILSGKLGKLTDERRQKVMKSVFGLTGVSAAQVILENGAKGLDRYTKGVGKAGAAQKLAESSSRGLMGTINRLKASVTSLGQSIFREFSPVIDDALKPLADAFDRMSAKAIPFLHHAIAQISAAFKSDLVPAFREMMPVIQPIATFLLKMFGSAVVGAIKGAIKLIKGVVNVFTGLFNLVDDLVHGRWSQLWGDFKQIISGALTAIKGLVQLWWNVGILQVFRRGFVFLTKGIWKKSWAALKGLTKRALDGVARVAKSALSGLGRLVLAALRGYLNLWKGYFKLIGRAVMAGWRALRSVFGGAISALRTMVSTFLGGIRAGFSRAWAAVRGATSRAWAAIRNAVNVGVGKVVNAMIRLPGRIVHGLGNLGKLLWNSGTAIISGLLQGIKDKAGDIVSTIKTWVTDRIPGFVKKALGIHSPSRVMRAIGVNIMAGLVRGIQDHRVPLERAMDAMTAYLKRKVERLKSVLSARNDVVSSLRGFTTSVFSADLSDPDTGAAPGVAALIAYQREQAAKASQLRADVRRLTRAGLSRSLLRQLIDSGESGMSQIHALASGGRGDIRELNRLNARTQAALGAAGLRAGNTLYGAAIKDARRDKHAAEVIVRELRKLREHEDRNTVVQLVIDGKVLRMSLLKLKRKNGQALGLA